MILCELPLLIRCALALLLLASCFAAPAQERALAPDTIPIGDSAAIRADSARLQAGALTSLGYWIYDGLAKASSWIAEQLKPVLRSLSRFFKKVFGEHYDDDLILRIPLSRRR